MFFLIQNFFLETGSLFTSKSKFKKRKIQTADVGVTLGQIDKNCIPFAGHKF